MSNADFYLVLDAIEIQGANAISSPITYGTPALSGFLGAIHALQRKVNSQLLKDRHISFTGALIASHECRVRRYRSNWYSDYTLNQSRNPITKEGKTDSIIEEGKVDMTVSLVIPVACKNIDGADWLSDNQKDFLAWVKRTLYHQRMAGGSVFAVEGAGLLNAQEDALSVLKPRLAPAHILMDARQELRKITDALQEKNPEATALDALLELAMLHHAPEKDEKDEKNIKWKTTSVRSGRGWLVPMPVGYQAISAEKESLQGSRSTDYPSYFVETVYSLGKWVSPYSLDSLESAFWRMHQPDSNGLYLIKQSNENSL